MPKDEKTIYDPLLSGTDVPPAEGDFSLEEILAEYGGSRQQAILRDVEKAVAPPQPEPPATPEPSGPTVEEESAPAAKEESDPETLREEARDKLLAQAVDLDTLELPQPPHPLSMKEVVSSTVDAVMEETQEPQEPILKHRRGLFSRKKIEDTEQLYDKPEPPPKKKPMKPEPPVYESAANYRERHRKNSGPLPLALLLALLPSAAMIAEQFGMTVPYWTGDTMFQSILLLGCLLFTAMLCRQVFARAFSVLRRHRFTSECLIVLSAVISTADCLSRILIPDHPGTTPYASVSALALVLSQWALSRESRGMYDTFRTVSMDDDPPYLVTDTGRGACKQKGSVPGFTNTVLEDNASEKWQTALMPVVAMAALVFGGLSSLGQGRKFDFLLNWSALLAAGGTFSLSLCWALPFSRLSSHLQKAGCAVAGWAGADAISRRKSMILSDTDLFPPGTIQLNGIKVISEDMHKVTSYAAAMTTAAGCGLDRLFEGLRRSECGPKETVDDFGFYEEGGYSGTIHGESVLLGTASFMRKMEVRLPGDINLKTGVFLAVDRQLIAVFAVKYNPSENVDFALRMMRHSHITPILASRDPNITPALLKRKFHKGVKVEYPDLTERVALSEAELDRGLPRALLLREGLLPYAEAVAGSRRLCKAVRWCTGLSLFGSTAGTLLAFYLLFLGAYSLLNPLALEIFLLLWALPVLLISDWTARY